MNGRLWRNGAAAALVGGLAGCAIDRNALDHLLLRGWPPPTNTPADLGIAFEDVRFRAANGKMLAAWFVPARNGPPRGTYLVHTGMEGNIARYLSTVAWGTQSEFNILIYDWEGFGASEGDADFDHFEPDARGAVDYLRSRPEPSCQRVIHVGASLGALPAIAEAAENPGITVGLILYGPFFPEQVPPIWLAAHVSPIFYPLGAAAGGLWAATLPDYLEPRRFIDRLRVPILVITPTDDDTIPPEEQMIVYDALPEPKELYETFGGHVHAPDRDPEMPAHVLTWSRRLPGLLPEGPTSP